METKEKNQKINKYAVDKKPSNRVINLRRKLKVNRIKLVKKYDLIDWIKNLTWSI